MSKSLVVADSFYGSAKQLRTHFDSRFEDPRRADAGRFVWDYWHVPDQYTLLRTPAWDFFPKKMYEQFHRHLVLWGRENLGCHDISPPWMSCYVDGCEQQLHGDLPHGPWAFVYSLTLWKQRKFRGGETLIVKDPILSFWDRLPNRQGLEHGQIFESIPAKFNRLVVFDPRVPHGVKRVEGVHDVRAGRLVIHGWFVQPRPFISGGQGSLPPRVLQEAIGQMSAELEKLLSQGLWVNGVLSLRFGVSRSGEVSGLKILSDTLKAPSGEQAEIVRKWIRRYWAGFRFGRQRSVSAVTLPLIFEASNGEASNAEAG